VSALPLSAEATSLIEKAYENRTPNDQHRISEGSSFLTPETTYPKIAETFGFRNKILTLTNYYGH